MKTEKTKKTNPFTLRAFCADTPVTLVKIPEAPPELEKYKPYLVQKPLPPDLPGAPKQRKLVVEKVVRVPVAEDS